LVIDVKGFHIADKMVNNQDSNFNPNVPTLKQVRDRLGMTQEQFAQAVGVSRRTVIDYESGKHQKLQLSMAQMKKLFELMEQAGLPIKELPDDIE
jgi:DNA-binding XRE family transcriptional regulator